MGVVGGCGLGPGRVSEKVGAYAVIYVELTILCLPYSLFVLLTPLLPLPLVLIVIDLVKFHCHLRNVTTACHNGIVCVRMEGIIMCGVEVSVKSSQMYVCIIISIIIYYM